MIRKNKHLAFKLFFSAILLISILAYAMPTNNNLLTTDGGSLKEGPRLSAQYNETKVHIDNNWSVTESAYDWCVKRGNVYYIENLTVDREDGGNGIIIENSNDYFYLQNIVVNDSISGGSALKIENSDNGIIENCKFLDNNGYGVMIAVGNNHTINNITIESNGARGLVIGQSNNISIQNSIIRDNTGYGVYSILCLDLEIIDNLIRNNLYALYLESTNKSFFCGNKIQINTNDIYQLNTEEIIIIVNEFEGIYTPINIDELGYSNLTWDRASEMKWCNGTGTYGDPFLLQNMVIDADSNSGILINNSRKYFKVENCNVSNGGTLYNAGIRLLNTTNGLIQNCNSSDNARAGISLQDESNNNTIRDNLLSHNLNGLDLKDSILNNLTSNTIYNNTYNGIRLYDGSTNNTIYNNFAYNNTRNGIYLEWSGNNTILKNNITDNIQNGIDIAFKSNNNTITDNRLYRNEDSGVRIFGNVVNAIEDTEVSNNIINNNGDGIRISILSKLNIIKENIIYSNTQYGTIIDNVNCQNTLIYDNNYTNNGFNAYDDGTSNSWNLTSLGNYWSNYSEVAGGFDADDDGIGDVDYDISGSANSKDEIPIWDDGHDGTTIHVDDTGVNSHDWATMKEKLFTWVLGSGTEADPYVLEDLIIDINNESSGIFIENSNVHFRIENCTVYNSTIAPDAGIRLLNVNNSMLTLNNVSNNRGHGIFLESSHDNLITLSNVTDNLRGIFLNNSNDNNITESSMNDNTQSGVHLMNSHNNTIFNNTNSFDSNGQYGIYFQSSDDNKINLNSISNNPNGIYLFSSDNNNITNNVLAGSTVGITEIGCSGNIFSGNSDDSISEPPDDGVPTTTTTTIPGNGGPIDLMMFIIIGAVAGVAVISIIVLSKRRKKEKPTEEEIRLKDKIAEKSRMKRRMLTGITTDSNDDFNELVGKINQTNAAGSEANDNENFERAIEFWNISIISLERAISEAKKLNREEFVKQCTESKLEIENKMSNVYKKEKEQKVNYFKDIANIRFILIVHLKMGATICSTEFTEGKIDKDLFGGFLSAITSFKSEMTRKIPTKATQGPPRHEILSQGFNITMYDGEFIRLAIISDERLGNYTHLRAFDALFKYENEHQEDLKYFKGNLKPFSDYKQFIDGEMGLSINQKCKINLENLDKIQVLNDYKNVLLELYENDSEFYPKTLPKLASNKAGINEVDSIYYTYLAGIKASVFYPIQEEPAIKDNDLGIELDMENKEATIKKLNAYVEKLNKFKIQNDDAFKAGTITQEKYLQNGKVIGEKLGMAIVQLEKFKN